MLDSLAQLITYGKKANAFEVQFEIRTEDDGAALSTLQGEGIIEWLGQHGYGEVLGEMLLKTIFPALLADYCQFISEALICSERASLTVTYALLRKPLRESLLYLEWLLANPNEMLNTLHNQPASELALNRLSSRERAVDIIQKAINRTLQPDIYNPDFLYDLRYNKSADYGFEQLWNKALHLVTTRHHLETEPRNLNFIFSDDSSRLSQWHHIYTRLPFLLFYTVDICYVLMAFVLGDVHPSHAKNAFKKSMGLLLWHEEIQRLTPEEDDIDYDIKPLQGLALTCPSCTQKIAANERLVRSLYEREFMICPNCRKKVTTSDLIAAS